MGKGLDICSQLRLRKVSNQKNQCEDRISCLPDEILCFIQSLLDYKKVAQMSILSHRWLNLWKHAHALEFGAPMLHDLHLRAPIVHDRRIQQLECDKFVSTITRESNGSDQDRDCHLLRDWTDPNGTLQMQYCDKSVFWMTSHTHDRRNQEGESGKIINQEGESGKIINWMSRVSQMHKGQNSNELTVSYTLYKCYKKKDIGCWWEDTLAREYQSLELNFLSNYDCQDSRCVFPEQFLGFCRDCLLWTLSSEAFDSRLLESSGLKSLKSLSLGGGILITHKTIDFILLNCAFLERLEVVGSPVLTFFQIKKGEFLALKYLKIEDCHNLGLFDIVYCNIVSLEISAPGILLLRQLPRLIELSINGTPCRILRNSLCQPELESLTLSPDKPKALAEHFELTSQLKKLKRLVINVDAKGDKSLSGLIPFINACPQLQEFVLMLGWVNPHRSGRMITGKVEKFSFKHLKVVEFLGYYGRVSDVELVVHLMENADNLEKVIIDPWNPQHIKHRHEEEEEARSLALQQLKELIPPLVVLIIR